MLLPFLIQIPPGLGVRSRPLQLLSIPQEIRLQNSCLVPLLPVTYGIRTFTALLRILMPAMVSIPSVAGCTAHGSGRRRAILPMDLLLIHTIILILLAGNLH